MVYLKRALVHHIQIYLLLYVDDINCKYGVEDIKHKLSLEFEIKDLGNANKILGIQIKRGKRQGRLELSQQQYFQKLLDRFCMTDCKSVKVPLAPHFKLSNQDGPQSEDEEEFMNQVPYISIIGSLIYGMICTQPDLACSMSVLSKYMANPKKTHWKTLKWVLRYMKGDINHGLTYGGGAGSSKQFIRSYSDVDYARCLDS